MAQAFLAFLSLAIAGVPAVAQDGTNSPHLPSAPGTIGTLHRDTNGKIEVIDPTRESAAGSAGCSKGTICVGRGRAYPTLSAALSVARPGDTIEVIGGTYRESAKITLNNLKVRGVMGRPHFDCAGLRLVEDKACLLLGADGATLENLEISGAQISDALGANGACVRNEPGVSYVLRDVICHGSQDGVLSDGGTILVENSQFLDNGWTGQTHNVYFSGDCRVTVRGSLFADARIGHEFKSRCAKTEISASTFRSTRGSRDLDIPDGGDTLVFGSTIIKGQGTENSEIIGYTPESCAHTGTMILRDVRIVNSDPQADIRNFNKCAGASIILDRVTIEGPAPKLIGLIRNQ